MFARVQSFCFLEEAEAGGGRKQNTYVKNFVLRELSDLLNSRSHYTNRVPSGPFNCNS